MVPRNVVHTVVAHGASRVPGLRRVPVVRLIAIGEVALLAHMHATKLTAAERRRLLALVRAGRGRPSRLSAEDREELSRLVAKAEPRLFAGEAVQRLSPVPLPRRLTHGRPQPT